MPLEFGSPAEEVGDFVATLGAEISRVCARYEDRGIRGITFPEPTDPSMDFDTIGFHINTRRDAVGSPEYYAFRQDNLKGSQRIGTETVGINVTRLNELEEFISISRDPERSREPVPDWLIIQSYPLGHQGQEEEFELIEWTTKHPPEDPDELEDLLGDMRGQAASLMWRAKYEAIQLTEKQEDR